MDASKAYPLKSAVEVLNKFPKAKFNETIDLAFRLGVDPKQSDQMVRGTVPLPHGSGKKVRVVVFAKGAAAETAKQVGADQVDLVGRQILLERLDCRGGSNDGSTAMSPRSIAAGC